MNKSDRDPDAYDRIRDDALTTEAARIAELEAQLAAATVALQLIAAYGTDGICPYGCDTPDIAANALAAQQEGEQ